MDRPAARPSVEDHWAPDHLVVERRFLTYAGRLLVARDRDGVVIRHSPLAGMAAVRQRFPLWALGPFGHIEPERYIPALPGVFGLVEHGVIRYLGASGDLARTFGRRGLGEMSRRDCQSAGNEEACRLNRLVTAAADAGRTVDVYLLPTAERRRPAWLPGAGDGESPQAVLDQMLGGTRGSWHLPS